MSWHMTLMTLFKDAAQELHPMVQDTNLMCYIFWAVNNDNGTVGFTCIQMTTMYIIFLQCDKFLVWTVRIYNS